ncbi:MAG: DinB family protein [Bryobacterales bacterium]|nr:DinB family protein [Bryobacterales bacterium]
MKLFLLLSITGALWAQNPMSADAKALYEGVRNNLIKAADKMPEENYSFKPVPEVRSFGQLVGHVADAQYLFCSAVKGEKVAPKGIEKTKTSKADLTAALKEAFAYCDAAYAAMTDADAAKITKFFGRERANITVLHFNNSHNNEHYGNIVTYMRIKGLVPPSSEGR